LSWGERTAANLVQLPAFLQEASFEHQLPVQGIGGGGEVFDL
jgi:hypothetical protein